MFPLRFFNSQKELEDAELAFLETRRSLKHWQEEFQRLQEEIDGLKPVGFYDVWMMASVCNLQLKLTLERNQAGKNVARYLAAMVNLESRLWQETLPEEQLLNYLQSIPKVYVERN